MTKERSARLRARFHRYLSTACRHHDEIVFMRCRVTCKFCGAKCRCWCHDQRALRHPLRWAAYQVRRTWTRLVG
jgi:hypothetical protein